MKTILKRTVKNNGKTVKRAIFNRYSRQGANIFNKRGYSNVEAKNQQANGKTGKHLRLLSINVKNYPQ